MDEKGNFKIVFEEMDRLKSEMDGMLGKVQEDMEPLNEISKVMDIYNQKRIDPPKVIFTTT